MTVNPQIELVRLAVAIMIIFTKLPFSAQFTWKAQRAFQIDCVPGFPE
jgi:hypothetical protein